VRNVGFTVEYDYLSYNKKKLIKMVEEAVEGAIKEATESEE
jgi:hypothetical protein